MPESAYESQERPAKILESVLQRAKTLYAESAGEKTDGERVVEGMSNQIIGETTQRAHQALIAQESQQLQETAAREQWSPEQLSQETATMHQRITAAMFQEHWFESTLSTRDYPIHAATYGTSMFRYDLRMLMAENPSPERLEEFAWIMFDVNGLRSFKDCTSHAHTTRFLQGIVRVFVEQGGPTRMKLKERDISVIPMATGGDEFVLYLRGRSPITPEYIGEIIASFQEEISSSDTLKSFLNFDDEKVLRTYGMPSSSQRKAFAKLNEKEQQEKLGAIRASLPDAFIPSVAGGGATLSQGILLAVEKDKFDLLGADETFLTIREKIVQSTIDLAEDRQKKNKEDDMNRLALAHPRSHKFRLRNNENRLLQEKNRKLEGIKAALEAELETVRAQLKAVLETQPNGNGAAVENAGLVQS